jgi:glycosyltransferase involved in cell wall biosynthesis
MEKHLTRIAFVHDRLYHMWGAEAVFLSLIQTSPLAPLLQRGEAKAIIFTLFSDKKSLEVDGQIIEIVTALPRWMFRIFQYFEKHRVPVLSKLFDYRNLMFFYPLLVWVLRQKIWKFGPDEMVVSSFAAVKNVLPKGEFKGQRWTTVNTWEGTKVKGNNTLWTLQTLWTLWTLKTTLYLHSPMQYIWDYYEDNVRKLSFPIKQFYQLITPVLRRWDKTPRYYDRVICNSHYTAAGAHRLYGRDHCEVQYPVIDPQYLQAALLHGSLQDDKSDYYVFIGRLVRFAKELDLIIRMFNQTWDKLMIIGSGPDETYLHSIAWPTIEFRWQINDVDDKIEIVWRSRGLVNLTRESFGMVTAEALCLWVPVFGYHEWGSVELVDEQSGILISNKKLDHVIEQFELFKEKQWDRKKIQHTMRLKLWKNN